MSTKGVDAQAFLTKLIGPLTLRGLLLAHRQSDEMSQEDFARLLGISKSHLSDIECGRKAVSPDRAARFARALQLSEAQFVRLALQDIVDRAGLRFKVQISTVIARSPAKGRATKQPRPPTIRPTTGPRRRT